ncbi:MAG: DEAD/DEAH box helicase [Kofleriaceae bacterium]
MDRDTDLTVTPVEGTHTASSDAFRALHELARRSCEDDALAELLAARALRVTAGADFGVARDACEALLRRLESSSDVVVQQVPGGYRAARRGKRAQRYELWLGETDGEGSCSCPDFGKSALGLCKHLLAVLQRPRYRRSPARALRWDPVRPLTGAGDRLERLWRDPRVPLPRHLAPLFQADHAIAPAALAPSRRAATIEKLLAAWRRDPRRAEPAVVPMLEAAQRAARQGLGPVRPRELARWLRGFKQPLYPYQREGVTAFLRAGRLLLADDMGLGKTAQAIACCHALFAAERVSRALVVAPAALKPQWLREWRAFTDLPIEMVEGDPEQRARAYRRRGPSVLLVNYEQLLRDLPQVLRYAPELVILDEAQRIKNWETRTASVVKQLEPAWRLVLTGTPMENRIEELSSIMEWVDEHALEPRWRLPSWHSVRADGGREIVGARNLDTLRLRLAPSMLRRVRREVLSQLPPRRDSVIPVPLTPEQQAAHDELATPIARLAATATRRPLAQPEFLRLMALLAQQRMICNALALRDFATAWPLLAHGHRPTELQLRALGSPKLLDLRERIVDLTATQQRKVVVFSLWRRLLLLADWVTRDVLARAGARAVFFTGQESQRRRTENLVAFHDDPSTRVLFASDAGGVGLNLQRAASCCINLELPWNPAVLEQRIGRIFRLGQEQRVEVYNYVASGGIEERIAQLVGDKRALFTGLFDGTTDQIAFDASGSFLSRVQELLRPDIADPEADEASDPPPPELDLDDREPDDLAPAPPSPAAPSPSLVLAAPQLDELARTLAQIEARPLAGGRVSLELPASAAGALGNLLRAVASALDRSTAGGGGS